MKRPRWYDKKLLKIAADHLMTAEQIGEVLECYGPDAVTRLRARRDLRVTVVDRVASDGGRPKNRYKIEKIALANLVVGPYCCGYCEIQRRESFS